VFIFFPARALTTTAGPHLLMDSALASIFRFT
jgi:hypothetical protein